MFVSHFIFARVSICLALDCAVYSLSSHCFTHLTLSLKELVFFFSISDIIETQNFSKHISSCVCAYVVCVRMSCMCVCVCVCAYVVYECM